MRPTLGAQEEKKNHSPQRRHSKQMKQRNNETLSLPIYKKTQNTLKTCETFLYAKSLKQRCRKNRITQLNFRITEKQHEPKVTIA
jgi:hypothetical protein